MAELPKLSQITRVLAAPEEYFESLVKSSLNIEVPPGPQSVLLRIQESIEKGELLSPGRLAAGLRVPRLEDILASFPRPPELPTERPAQVAPTQEARQKPITF